MSEPDNIPREPFAVFCGLDVGKSEHHACALDVAGRRMHDKALPNDEPALRGMFTALAEHGRVLVVVDQPASIGAVAVARTALVAAVVVAMFSAAGCSTAAPPPTSTAPILERPATTGVFANLYLPPAPDAARGAAVLVLGGSEGGFQFPNITARELAAHGRPAMALAYFGSPGLPTALRDIPLEYFATALRLLATQPGVDPGKLVIWGNSRGSEAALLTAAAYPDLVDAVIADSPSSVANPGYPDGIAPAWTFHGTPVPRVDPAEYKLPDPPGAPAAVIPVDRIRGPILTLCGGADLIWPSCPYAHAIATRADTRPRVPPVTELAYPGAGHAFLGFDGPVPAGAANTSIPRVGGTYSADAQASIDARPRLASFLADL